ncbi:MAG: Hpt domain-containing protein [Thiotrichaceae bacterium]
MKLLELPEQTPATDLDEEIIDIFVEEAKEVMEEISANYDTWKDNPADSEALQNLRRAFHTLKGSGRLVGALVIGELGWRFESMLNRVMEGSLTPSDKMYFIIAEVPKLLPDMIYAFKNDIPTPYEVKLLVSQADYLTRSHGESLGDFDPPDAHSSATPPPEKSITPVKSSPVPPTKPIVVEVPEPESEDVTTEEDVTTAEFNKTVDIDNDFPELTESFSELLEPVENLPIDDSWSTLSEPEETEAKDLIDTEEFNQFIDQ